MRAKRERSGEQRIRFCRTGDGLTLAWATSGTGPPLVKAANWLSHLEYDWKSPVWRPLLERLGARRTVVRYDERGCGLSDRQVDDLSFDAWVRDLEAVVDAAGLERFPLLGISQGGPIAVEYAVRHPERVSRLVLYGTYLRGRLRRDPTVRDREEAETLVRLIRMGWGKDVDAYRRFFASLFWPDATTEQMRAFAELQRVSASAETAARIVEGFDALDVSGRASSVSVPTLVLHVEGDARIPFEEGRRVASTIPDAAFVPLPGVNHVLAPEDPAFEPFLEAVEGFLREDRRPGTGPPPDVAGLTPREREVLDLLALHGTGGDAARLRAFLGGQLEREADRRGWLVAYPEALDGAWNDCREGTASVARERGVDDVAYLRSLVRRLAGSRRVDTDRLYLLGYSGGGHMAFRVALEAPGLARAIAVFGANLPAEDDSTCRPEEGGVSVLLVNGTRDLVNPFAGGDVIAPNGVPLGAVRSAEESAAYLERRAAGDGEVALVRVEGGGHVVPGRASRFPLAAGRTARSYEGIREALDFFERQAPGRAGSGS